MITDEELRKLVLCRLEAMPDTIRVSLGSGQELSKNDLIDHVKKGDEMGQRIIHMQLEYLRAMKFGF